MAKILKVYRPSANVVYFLVIDHDNRRITVWGENESISDEMFIPFHEGFSIIYLDDNENVIIGARIVGSSNMIIKWVLLDDHGRLSLEGEQKVGTRPFSVYYFVYTKKSLEKYVLFPDIFFRSSSTLIFPYKLKAISDWEYEEVKPWQIDTVSHFRRFGHNLDDLWYSNDYVIRLTLCLGEFWFWVESFVGFLGYLRNPISRFVMHLAPIIKGRNFYLITRDGFMVVIDMLTAVGTPGDIGGGRNYMFSKIGPQCESVAWIKSTGEFFCLTSSGNIQKLDFSLGDPRWYPNYVKREACCLMLSLERLQSAGGIPRMPHEIVKYIIKFLN